MVGQTLASKFSRACPEWSGYRPARVRISSAVARIVGAIAPKAPHQILAFCFADIFRIQPTSSSSRAAYRIAAVLPQEQAQRSSQCRTDASVGCPQAVRKRFRVVHPAA